MHPNCKCIATPGPTITLEIEDTAALAQTIAKTLRTPLRNALPRKTWDASAYYDWQAALSGDDGISQADLDEMRQGILSLAQIPPSHIRVFHEEKPMYIPRNYEIREVSRDSYDYSEPVVIVEVKGIDSLPAALARLAAMGHDMAPSLEALQAACDEQRKRKALDEAISGLTKPAEKAK